MIPASEKIAGSKVSLVVKRSLQRQCRAKHASHCFAFAAFLKIALDCQRIPRRKIPIGAETAVIPVPAVRGRSATRQRGAFEVEIPAKSPIRSALAKGSSVLR